jgi:hypothetical protein
MAWHVVPLDGAHAPGLVRSWPDCWPLALKHNHPNFASLLLAFPRVIANYFTMCCLAGLFFPSICCEAEQVLSENDLFGTTNVEKAHASSEPGSSKL